MSKKVVSFVRPGSPLPKPPAVSFAVQGADSWIGAAEDRESPTPGPWTIDLERPRNWFELMQLVWVFPYIATWRWMLQAARVPGKSE